MKLFFFLVFFFLFQTEHGEYAIVTPDLGLFYPAVSYLETKMYTTLNKDPFKNLPIAVNCIFFKGFDYTAIKVKLRWPSFSIYYTSIYL